MATSTQNESIIQHDNVRSNTFACVALISVTVFMFIFGLIMVFSASSITLMENGSSPWDYFYRQAVFGVVGIASMLFLSRIPIQVYENLALLTLVITDVLLVLVQLAGFSVGGNKNWILIAGFQLQPSELAKLTLCIWLGMRLAKNVDEGNIRKISKVFDLRTIGGIFLTLALVLLGQDLGTAMVFMVFLFGELFLSGIPGKFLTIIFVVGAIVVGAYVMTSSNRMERILGNYNNCGGDTQGICYQSTHALYALATGGLLGVGPGASREKWSYLPEAHNDFIFAITGEELGLVGTLIVLICYIFLIAAMISIIIRSNDQRAKIITGGILCWIAGQAIFNIGAVLRFLPVVGVPLPLISYGGTSLIATLSAMGVVLSFARHRTVRVSTRKARDIKTVVSV